MLKEKMLNAIFITSKQPVLYRDLLRANSLYNEGMLVDPSALNFKIKTKNLYFIYSIICFLVVGLTILATHAIFVKVDFHVSLIGTAIATAMVFICFHLFTEWLRRDITLKLIKEAWKVHFPHFPYEKYSQRVEELYGEALKKEIPKKDWERFVLEHLTINP